MAGIRLVLVAVVAAVLCIADGRPQTGDNGVPIRLYSQSDRRHGQDGMQQPSSQPVRPFSQASDHPRVISQSLPVRPFNQREPEDLPVRPFDQYDNNRGAGSSSSRVVPPPTSSPPVKPFSQGERDHETRHTPREQARRESDPNQSRAHVSPILNPTITLQTDRDRQQQRTQQHHSTHHHATSASQRKDEIPHWSTGQVQQPSSTALHRDNRRTNPQDQAGKAGGSRGQQSGSSVRMGAQDEALPEQGKSDGAQEGIIFPGPTKEASKATPGRFAPQVGIVGPNCAKGSTFCEAPESYPSEYLKTVLRKEGDGLMEFFGNDLLLNDTSISQRIDQVDENPLCQSVEQVVYPKMAQNKEDKWLYVVNQDQYIQGVRVEKCLKPESECLLTKSFPLGYKTICRQKYIYRRLVALNDDGKAHSDTFRLPSCCSCFVKSVSGAERKR